MGTNASLLCQHFTNLFSVLYLHTYSTVICLQNKLKVTGLEQTGKRVGEIRLFQFDRINLSKTAR